MSEGQDPGPVYALVEQVDDEVDVVAQLPPGADPSGVFDAFESAEQREPGE
jgi:hypothetical protein